MKDEERKFKMAEFGEQLKKAREEKGLSQQALAEQLYVTRQSISRWERGDRYPDLVTTKRIAQILELSIDEMLSEKEIPEVVEKSPVIESRMGNNISIALYMSIVLLRLIEQLQNLMEWYGIQATKRFDYGTIGRVSVFCYVIEALYIAIFSYGLYCAIKDIQTPKRIGIILISYCLTFMFEGFFWFCYNFRYTVEVFNRSFRNHIFEFISIYLESDIPYYGPAIMLLIASYFFLIRGSKHKLWVYVIMIASIWGIIEAVNNDINWMLNQRQNVMDNCSYTIYDATMDSIYIVRDFFAKISLYALIICQTLTLYRKRKTAFDLSGEKEIDQVTA